MYRSCLRQVVAERGPEHIVDTFGSNSRSAGARPSLTHRIAILNALAQATAIALVNVVPVAACHFLYVAGLRAARASRYIAGRTTAVVAGVGGGKAGRVVEEAREIGRAH